MLSGVLPDNPREKKNQTKNKTKPKSERIARFMSYWEEVSAKLLFWGSGVVTLHTEGIL